MQRTPISDLKYRFSELTRCITEYTSEKGEPDQLKFLEGCRSNKPVDANEAAANPFEEHGALPFPPDEREHSDGKNRKH